MNLFACEILTFHDMIRQNMSCWISSYSFNFKKNSRFDVEDEFFAHVIDVHILIVQMRNVTNQFVIVFKNAHIDKLQKYTEEECFLVVSKNRHLTIKFTKWLRKTFKWVTIDVIDLIALEKVFHASIMSIQSTSSIFILNVFIVVNLTSKISRF